MTVLVDTSVWSLAFRRSTPQAHWAPYIYRLATLLDDVTAAIIGPVRQELLSGIRDPAQFSRLRDRLAALSDTPINSEDYIAAAEHSNTCRRHGLQGSSIDFLICAVAIRYHWPVLTTDTDFVGYAQHLPLTLDIYPA